MNTTAIKRSILGLVLATMFVGTGVATHAAPSAQPDKNYLHNSWVSAANLKELGLALGLYAADHDGNLPDMDDSKSFRNALLPYVNDKKVFMSPTVDEPYAVDPVLSMVNIDELKHPERIVAAYEPTASRDGSREALFMDFHVARVGLPRISQAPKPYVPAPSTPATHAPPAQAVSASTAAANPS